MYEIHNLNANAMIASAAHRRALARRAPSRVHTSVRWWRRSGLRATTAEEQV